MKHSSDYLDSQSKTALTIRLMIVDDHHVFTEALSFALDGEAGLEVVATAANPDEAMQALATTSKPIDIVLMDIRMGEGHMDGIEAAALIHEQYADVQVMILSMHNHGKHIQRAIEQQVSAYLLKESHAEELIKAIHQVAKGEKYFSQEVRATLTDYQIQLLSNGTNRKPTPREMQVLKLIVDGLSTSEIGERLFIGEAGVETHRRNLRQKLGVKNTAGLVREAIKRNLVELS